MLFFALASMYFLISKKKSFSLLFLALSVGIKYVTLSLLPLILLGFRRYLAVFLMSVSLILVIFQIEIQPW